MSHPESPAPSRSRPVKRPLVWSGLVLIVLSAAYGAVWFTSASILRNGVERWIAERRAEGLTIQTAAPALAGFPTKVAVRLSNVTLSTPTTRGAWRWRAAKVDVVASPLSLSRISLDLSGTHDISGGWIAESAPLHLSSEHAHLGLIIGGDGRVIESHFSASGISASWPNEQTLIHADTIDAVVSLAGDHGATPAVTSHLVLGLENVSLPPMPAPITPTLRKLSLTANIDGPVSAGPLPQVLEAWRTAGGVIDVKDFTVDWPPLFVAGNGTAALDENLQPIGAFTTRVSGLDPVIDVIAAKAGLDQRAAGLAKGVIGLLSQNGANGREMQVSVTVQNRMLSIGPLQLLEIPPITWPAAATP